MRILKKGDLCPLCGQPILTDDPNALRLLAAIADIAGLLELGTENVPVHRPGTGEEGAS